MSYFRLLRVPFMLAIALAAVNFAIVGFLQPSARYLYEELRFELRSGAFGAKVRVGEFNNVGKNLTVRIDVSRNNGMNCLVCLICAKNKGRPSQSPRKRASFAHDDPDTIYYDCKRAPSPRSAQYESPRVLVYQP